jgi:hypothetical protein
MTENPESPPLNRRAFCCLDNPHHLRPRKMQSDTRHCYPDMNGIWFDDLPDGRLGIGGNAVLKNGFEACQCPADLGEVML